MNMQIHVPTVIMGVAGAGKTTIGEKLAEKINATFLDGDDYHPGENIRKMKQGIPLSDEDRSRWIRGLNKLLQREILKGKKIVLACSALRSAHREMLSENISLSFVYLKIDRNTAVRRSRERKDHFFSSSLMDNQFKVLEEPENSIMIDSTEPVSRVLEKLCCLLPGEILTPQRGEGYP
jgi:gluconokinase